MSEKQRCEGRVRGEGQWGAFHTHQCTKAGSLEHDGKTYCKLHHPPSRKEREKVKWEAYKERVSAEEKRKAEIAEAAQNERAELLKDKARLDWLEKSLNARSWNSRSWLCRGEYAAPEVVPAKVGDKWPEGITQPTARAAIDAAMNKK